MPASKLENLYELARRAKTSRDWSTAARYYQDILYENPNDWEATFYVGLNDASSCTLAEFENATKKLENAFKDAIRLIDKNNIDSAKCIIDEMSTNTISTLTNFRIIAMKHYSQFVSLPNSKSEYNSRRKALSSCARSCGFSISISHRYPKLRELCVNLYLFSIELECEVLSEFPASMIPSLRILVDFDVKKVQEFRPDYKNPVDELLNKLNSASSTTNVQSSGGCYVATAVYGSYDCPEVWTLRRSRDNTLAESIFGRAFIHTYYAISPTLVKWFGETQWFKKLFKGKLDKMVKNLNDQGVENTPYEDKSWK